MSSSEKPTPPSITARPSLEEKARFAALAAVRGLSESALALMAIRTVLRESDNATLPAAMPARKVASDRITIRLRPGDGEVIAHRAEQRGMKTSTYLAALVRAHLAAKPPLAANELLALKQAVWVLADLRRFLAQLDQTSKQGIRQEHLQHARALVVAVERRAQEFAKAALISWEIRSD